VSIKEKSRKDKSVKRREEESPVRRAPAKKKRARKMSSSSSSDGLSSSSSSSEDEATAEVKIVDKNEEEQLRVLRKQREARRERRKELREAVREARSGEPAPEGQGIHSCPERGRREGRGGEGKATGGGG
jgi:hypothetical protein